MLGAEATPFENKVQIQGTAMSIPVAVIKEMFEQCQTFRQLLLRFTHSHMIQLSQTALCNSIHNVEQRLARWLLLSHDRSDSDVLPFTQEMLSLMLGVHRPTVAAITIRLKHRGFIEYKRGQILVQNRKQLEEFCCRCYGVVKEEYDEVMKINQKHIVFS